MLLKPAKSSISTYCVQNQSVFKDWLAQSLLEPQNIRNLLFIKVLGHMPFIGVHGNLLSLACGINVQIKTSV